MRYKALGGTWRAKNEVYGEDGVYGGDANNFIGHFVLKASVALWYCASNIRCFYVSLGNSINVIIQYNGKLNFITLIDQINIADRVHITYNVNDRF